MRPMRGTLRERFYDSFTPEPMSGCWLWTKSLGPRGYGQIGVGPRCQPARAHRVSWELHRGEIPAGAGVLHKCDTPCCVNPDHLFLGDQGDNTADMMRKARAPVRLSRDEVQAIRQRRADGETLRALAREMGICHRTVGRICGGRERVHG